LKKINASTLGLFGAQDRGITPDDVKKFGAAMHQLGEKVKVKIYDDAGHAFENPNNKDGYRAADAAWSRAVDFLAMTLKKLGWKTQAAPNHAPDAGFCLPGLFLLHRIRNRFPDGWQAYFLMALMSGSWHEFPTCQKILIWLL
jgi:Dienelactone hydrolase family